MAAALRVSLAAACLTALARGAMSLFDPSTGAPIGDLDMPSMPKPDWGHIPVTRPLMCQACNAAMTEAHRVVGKAWAGVTHTTGDVGRVKRTFGSKVNLGAKEAQLIEEIEKNFCYPGNFRSYTVFPPELEAACKGFMDDWNDDSTVEETLADTSLPVAAARAAACGRVCEPVPEDERMPSMPEPPEGGPAPGAPFAPPLHTEGAPFTPPWLRDEANMPPMFTPPKAGATAAPFLKKTAPARKATAEEILELREKKRAAKAEAAAKAAAPGPGPAAPPA